MSSITTELQQRLEKAKKELQVFQEYADQQKTFKFPEAEIKIEPNNDRVEVYMDVEYAGTKFHFESMKVEHLKFVHAHIDSQSMVREKYADGKTRTLGQTTSRVNDLSNRFMKIDKEGKPKIPNLYSGFIISDLETNIPLGMAVEGGASHDPHASEMAFLNRSESFSHSFPKEIVEAYELDNKITKKYTGVGTTEVCTLLQYAATLKTKNYPINGNEFSGEIVMTARVDNPGSWKAGAKGGFKVYDIDSNPQYGPELRYQMRTKI